MSVAVEAIVGLRLNARRPDRLADFFVEALGFDRTAWGVSLAGTKVALAEATGADYPGEVPGWSQLFQHFAIVVPDMASAYARLRQARGWRPITTGGPQDLPASSGGVTAFKFRDPEGHPLELLALSSSKGSDLAVPRIDHSGISVRDAQASLAFYRGLGLRVGRVTFNRGVEQDRLDGLERAEVDITRVAPARETTPHMELLAYRGDFPLARPAEPGDVAATRLLFRATGGEPGLLLRDPDGHLLEIETGR